MNLHIWEATTVGIAQGTSTAALTMPLPLKCLLIIRAMMRPKTSSKKVDAKTKAKVFTSECRATASCNSSR